MIVISDTTPLITLLKINQLDLLKDYFGEIIIPKAVFAELTENSNFQNEAEIIDECKFIRVVDVQKKSSVELLRKITGLDLGESESIILADELNADLLLMDERKGRDVALKMSVKIMGSIGFLMASYKSNMLSSDEILDCINKIQKTGRHIGEKHLDMLRALIDS